MPTSREQKKAGHAKPPVIMTPEERRRHSRYSRTDLAIDIARPGLRGILSVSPLVECFNFSRTGLKFGSDRSFRIGEKLILDLRVFDIQVHEVCAEVVTSERLESGGWCCGVRFCFEDKNMQRPEVHHALLQIEAKLRAADEFPYSPV
jgi:hypothetical protein